MYEILYWKKLIHIKHQMNFRLVLKETEKGNYNPWNPLLTSLHIMVLRVLRRGSSIRPYIMIPGSVMPLALLMRKITIRARERACMMNKNKTIRTRLHDVCISSLFIFITSERSDPSSYWQSYIGRLNDFQTALKH